MNQFNGLFSILINAWIFSSSLNIVHKAKAKIFRLICDEVSVFLGKKSVLTLSGERYFYSQNAERSD